MNLEPSVVVNGVEWKLFGVNYRTPDGQFTAFIYAVDAEHGSYMLESLKENGKINEVPQEF